MCVVGLRGLWRKKERLLPRYSTAGTVHEAAAAKGERVAARVGGAGNAGRGASPTAGKREGISF